MYLSNGNVRTDYLKPGCECIVQEQIMKCLWAREAEKLYPSKGLGHHLSGRQCLKCR